MAKKSIKTLLEGELEKAEVELAARDLVDKMQDIIKNLTKIKVEDLPALKESMRASIGNDQATQFVGAVDPALQAAIEAVTQTKEQLDQAALSVSGEGGMPTDGMGMGGDEIPGGEEGEAPVTGTAAGGEEEPLGRGKREESRFNKMKAMMESLERKIYEVRRQTNRSKARRDGFQSSSKK